MSFNPVELITRKRDGEKLSAEEITWFITEYTNGVIPDYQMSAMLMAIYFQGMSTAETAAMTEVMLHSGPVLNLRDIPKPKVDKHSTGGIGDKTSIILAPLLACFDIAVPMIAGRGLGHTGGTIDKLESIPGFQTELGEQRFKELLSTIGVALIGQSKDLCPADKKLYGLRDVSGTVPAIPLIVSSIMSKKLAEDFDGLVLDVKFGSGAFMKSLKEAKKLAKAMVNTGKHAGRQVVAVLTDMSQPLGRTVGNAIEINECVEFLRRGPQDPEIDKRLYDCTMSLAAEMLILGRKQMGKRVKPKDAKKELEAMLLSGRPYSKFLEMVSLQGGDTAAIDVGLPLAKIKKSFNAPKSGTIHSMDAQGIGMVVVDLGGGRRAATDPVDHGVGLEFNRFVGDRLQKGENIVNIYANSENDAKNALERLQGLIAVGSQKKSAPKLVRERIV